MTSSEALGAVLEPGDDSGGEPLSSSDAGMSFDEERELDRALRGEESESDGKFSSEKGRKTREQDLAADQLSGLSPARLGNESEPSDDHSELGDQRSGELREFGERFASVVASKKPC